LMLTAASKTWFLRGDPMFNDEERIENLNVNSEKSNHNTPKGKIPSFQFYPGDWMKDPSLRSVSVGARGLWIDLLCLLFESKTRHKMDFKTSVDEATLISRMTGVSKKQVIRFLKELEEANVLSRDDNRMIYSRRMKRDEYVRQIRSEAGKLGGNPALLNQKDKQDSKLTSTPSSSSLLSSSPSPSSSSSEEHLLKTSFQKPSLQELRKYFCELGDYFEEAEKFFDYYESNGWMVGVHHMKDWQASVRNWTRNKENF